MYYFIGDIFMNEENLIKYYNKFNEDKRLNTRHGQIEFITSMKYIKEYLKEFNNPKILDVGAGTGKYSINLANDGYDVIFSYNEIFNTKNGDNIIVFYKKNGKLLEPHEGKIALISTDDIKNGPRHIKWLQKIIVKKID